MIILLIALFILLLVQSGECCLLAYHSLILWFNTMIPSLFPMMVVTFCLVKSGKATLLVKPIQPIFDRLFHVRPQVTFCILSGLLCGFPMGAKITAESYEDGKISLSEARYLLCFCNQLGPAYFCGFAYPLLKPYPFILAFVGMYMIPLLYGLLLSRIPSTTSDTIRESDVSCSLDANRKRLHVQEYAFLVEDGIRSSVLAISTLGGYIIICSVCTEILKLLLEVLPLRFDILPFLYPLLEISGGLKLLGDLCPVYSLICMTFSGICCTLQTISYLNRIGLSLGLYLRHRILLTLFVCAYYFLVSFLIK